MNTLKPGHLLRCVDSGLPCRVEALIGEGGQGEVYRVTLNGQPYALKWYSDFVLKVDRTLRQRLQVAIDIGAPSPCFLWPFELVTLADGSRLGYLMRLRRAPYEKIQALLAQQIRPSFRVLAMIGWKLTDALLALHAKGLAYQDLNAGNVFFHPETGDIEICDNDNVDIDGAPSVMGGVWEFQAPEVVLRHSGPSRATDLHSLAVMLFRILHVGHPLVGRRELAFPNLSDQSVMRRLYGSEAKFVFDPADESNRPLPERHGPVLGHWAIYPAFLRELFVRAFTEGLHDPAARVQESEWRRAMRQLHDAVFTCSHCRAQSFYDPRRIAARHEQFECWCCQSSLPAAPPRLGLKRADARSNEAPAHVVVLEEGVHLFAHHIGDSGSGPDAPVAEVLGDIPPRMLNRSTRPWTIESAGSSRSVMPGDAIALEASMRLRFGAVDGLVRL
jgi:eukaryotic-like serine/threonine-protein kinase